MKLWAPLDIFKQRLNLKKTDFDQEVRQYALKAEEIIQKLTNRLIDGGDSTTEYLDGGFDFVQLRNYPIRSITSIKEDEFREWGSGTEVAAADRFTDEGGAVYKRSGSFSVGNKTVQAIYTGGYFPNTSVVAEAAPNESHTIANSLSTYSDDFTVYVRTNNTTTDGTVTVTGTDQNGAAISETVTPKPTPAQSGADWTITTLENYFQTVTAVNSSEMGEDGTVEVTASSVPRDLVLCAEIIAGHFYLQDQKGIQGVGQRTYSSSSESNLTQDIPKEAMIIIQSRKSYQS